MSSNFLFLRQISSSYDSVFHVSVLANTQNHIWSKWSSKTIRGHEFQRENNGLVFWACQFCDNSIFLYLQSEKSINIKCQTLTSSQMLNHSHRMWISSRIELFLPLHERSALIAMKCSLTHGVRIWPSWLARKITRLSFLCKRFLRICKRSSISCFFVCRNAASTKNNDRNQNTQSGNKLQRLYKFWKPIA